MKGKKQSTTEGKSEIQGLSSYKPTKTNPARPGRFSEHPLAVINIMADSVGMNSVVVTTLQVYRPHYYLEIILNDKRTTQLVIWRTIQIFF